MRSIIRCVATITLLATLFAIPTVARSQATTAAHTPRAPVWATLSLGRGDLRVNCAICRTTDQTSWAADITVGGWINARTTLGGELGAWRLGGDEATQRVMMVSAVSQLYPLSKVPGFVKLGLGMMNYRSTDEEQSLSARSLAVQAGFGVDIPVKRRYVVVPHATLVQGFNRGLYLDDEKVTSGSQLKLVRFGLGFGVRR
jgi:LSD1 subclass zinc finger protein